MNTNYSEKLPTEDQIFAEADALRAVFSTLYPLTDEEALACQLAARRACARLFEITVDK